jgi:hypothetical protein
MDRISRLLAVRGASQIYCNRMPYMLENRSQNYITVTLLKGELLGFKESEELDVDNGLIISIA